MGLSVNEVALIASSDEQQVRNPSLFRLTDFRPAVTTVGYLLAIEGAP